MRVGRPSSVTTPALVAWAVVVVLVGIIVGLATRSPNLALGVTLVGGGIYGFVFHRHL